MTYLALGFRSRCLIAAALLNTANARLLRSDSGAGRPSAEDEGGFSSQALQNQRLEVANQRMNLRRSADFEIDLGQTREQPPSDKRGRHWVRMGGDNDVDVGEDNVVVGSRNGNINPGDIIVGVDTQEEVEFFGSAENRSSANVTIAYAEVLVLPVAERAEVLRRAQLQLGLGGCGAEESDVEKGDDVEESGSGEKRRRVQAGEDTEMAVTAGGVAGSEELLEDDSEEVCEEKRSSADEAMGEEKKSVLAAEDDVGEAAAGEDPNLVQVRINQPDGRSFYVDLLEGERMDKVRARIATAYRERCNSEIDLLNCSLFSPRTGEDDLFPPQKALEADFNWIGEPKFEVERMGTQLFLIYSNAKAAANASALRVKFAKNAGGEVFYVTLIPGESMHEVCRRIAEAHLGDANGADYLRSNHALFLAPNHRGTNQALALSFEDQYTEDLFLFKRDERNPCKDGLVIGNGGFFLLSQPGKAEEMPDLDDEEEEEEMPEE